MTDTPLTPLIKGAGLNPSDFTGLSQINLAMRDTKGNAIDPATLSFSEGDILFSKVPHVKDSFAQFLHKLEKSDVQNLIFTLNETNVIAICDNGKPQVFWRIPSEDSDLYARD